MSGLGNKEIFAKNLLFYVNKCGRDQRELAEIVGVAPSTFNEWVKGKKYPRIDKIEILANYFGILKSDLIEEHKGDDSSRTITLTEGERTILELLRRLPESKQRMAIQMLQVALADE